LAKTAAGALWQPGGRAGRGTLWLDVLHHTPAGQWSAITRVRCARRLESWERLKERTLGPLVRGGAADRLRLQTVRGLWVLCVAVLRSGVRNVPTRMRLCCLYICCSLLTVCVLLSASRDEEVVDGRSQVRQPGGEFNCPRVGDQRED